MQLGLNQNRNGFCRIFFVSGISQRTSQQWFWCGLNGRCVGKQQPWELLYTFKCISRCYGASLSEQCYGFMSLKEVDQQEWAEGISLWHLLWRSPEVLWLRHELVTLLSSPSLTQNMKCCCLLCHGISAYQRHKRTMWPTETENVAGEASMKEAWTSLSCIICILSETINVSNPPCGVYEITSRYTSHWVVLLNKGGMVHSLADLHSTMDLISNDAKILSHGTVQNRFFLCSVFAPQLAKNQEEEGCISMLLGERS